MTKRQNSSFYDLGVHPDLVEALKHEGINEPFPIQAAALPEAIEGRDVLGRGQTGSGKTLAFGLTVMTRLAHKRGKSGQPMALILAPTRELAMQIDDVISLYAESVNLSSTVLAGGMPYPPQLKALQKGVQIVVATPGRLQDHIKRGTIDLSRLQIAVLDEADQMADMGFLPVVTEILAMTPSGGQRLLFSATLDKDVDALVKKFLKNPVTHSLAVDAQREVDMDHHVLVVEPNMKEAIIGQIAARDGRTIFFVRTKMGADRLTEQLREMGVDVGVLHGGRTQKQRSRVLDSFKGGYKRALIATDVAARGIHVDDVSLVVHVDPPENHKDYLHRAGRTARAGAKGTVVSVATYRNKKRVHTIAKEAGVKMNETRVESLHPELIRITGAQEPSGIPVKEESVPRSERSKPGRRGSSSGVSRGPRKPRENDERPARAPRKFEGDERPARAPRSFDRDDKFAKNDRPARAPRKFESDEGPARAPRKFDRDEKFAKRDRPARAPRKFESDERPARAPRKFDRDDKFAKNDRPARAPRKFESDEGPARAPRKFDRDEKFAKSDRPARAPRKFESDERPARAPHKFDRDEKFAKSDRPARAPRKFESDERPARAPRSFDRKDDFAPKAKRNTRPGKREREEANQRPDVDPRRKPRSKFASDRFASDRPAPAKRGARSFDRDERPARSERSERPARKFDRDERPARSERPTSSKPRTGGVKKSAPAKKAAPAARTGKSSSFAPKSAAQKAAKSARKAAPKSAKR
jgi:superfamily II DNA/RNA helicase